MRITVGTYTIYDDAEGWTLSDTTGSIARIIQEVGKVRADEITTINRGLKKTDISFTVSKPCESEAAVLEEVLLREQQIPEDGVIRFMCRDTSGVEVPLYLKGHLRTVSFSFKGKRAFNTYQIVGGAIRDKNPT